jgi:succinate dehydrogenase/fumarate reductase flavoprotein subunit
MLADGLGLQAAELSASVFANLTAEDEAQVAEIIAKLQASMWIDAGLLRQESTLCEGMRAQQECAQRLAALVAQGKGSRRLTEAQAISRVAQAILFSSLARTESRGAHYRNDFPKRDDANFRKHSIFSSDGQVAFEKW